MPAKRKGPETSEAAPKRAPTPRQAKVGKDVHLHNSLGEPITTDFKLTHQLSES
jgi:hypothetical protein